MLLRGRHAKNKYFSDSRLVTPSAKASNACPPSTPKETRQGYLMLRYLLSIPGLIAILVKFFERDLFAFIFGGLLALFSALS